MRNFKQFIQSRADSVKWLIDNNNKPIPFSQITQRMSSDYTYQDMLARLEQFIGITWTHGQYVVAIDRLTTVQHCQLLSVLGIFKKLNLYGNGRNQIIVKHAHYNPFDFYLISNFAYQLDGSKPMPLLRLGHSNVVSKFDLPLIFKDLRQQFPFKKSDKSLINNRLLKVVFDRSKNNPNHIVVDNISDYNSGEIVWQQ